jgi:hypothetical protein
LASLSPVGRESIRHPHPEILHILDSRLLLDDAAAIAARYGGGLLIAESLAAGLVHGRALWFGFERNVGRLVGEAATDLGIEIRVVT